MESYTFIVDNRLTYPYKLIENHSLYASETIGDMSVFVYQYHTSVEMYQYHTSVEIDEIKKAFDETYSSNYKFNLKYFNESNYVDATMYAQTIVQVSSMQYDESIKFLNSEVWPIAETILQKEYIKGNIKLPIFFFFGESCSYKTQKLERYELDFLALQKYAGQDFYPNHWKDYALYKEDVFMLKYGAYEKTVSVNVTNCFNDIRSVTNIKGLEQRHTNLTNWIWVDSGTRTRIVGLDYSSTDYSSDIVQLLTKKEFWLKFVLPQFLDENVLAKYALPINNKTFLVSRFVSKLLETERTEVANMESTILENRQQIESYIQDITIRKLKLIKQESEIVAKKKSVTSETKLRASLANQMATLMAHPYIEDIEIGEKFVIKTTPIKVDGVVSIGGYFITLTMGQKPLIKVVNYENPKEGFDHPHVPRSNPCWGNYTDIFVHLANTDLISTMEIIFRFLESWNPVDMYGKNLIWWDAEYAFNTLESMGLMHTVERSWRDYYRDTFGEEMGNPVCESCGEEEDYCECYCPRCGERIDDSCDCERCEHCGNLWEDGYRDCGCERCDYCGEHYDNCECSYCEHCDENIDAGNCGCERCEECQSLIEDCECDRCAICNELAGSCDCEDNPIIAFREGQLQMETIV